MQALSPLPHHGDEVGFGEEVEMLCCRLAGHLETSAKLSECLPVPLPERLLTCNIPLLTVVPPL